MSSFDDNDHESVLVNSELHYDYEMHLEGSINFEYGYNNKLVMLIDNSKEADDQENLDSLQ